MGVRVVNGLLDTERLPKNMPAGACERQSLDKN